MELPHIGHNCALQECNRLDFLPVKCDACSQVYCIEHYRYENHRCEKAQRKDLQVPVCPLCMQPVGIKRDQLPDIAVSEHIDKYCSKNDLLKGRLNKTPNNSQTSLQKCSVKSCKQKDVIYLECQDCKTKFCIKHRHPSDHDCTGPRKFSSNLSDNWNSFRGSCSTSAVSGLDMLKSKAQQISQSGQAALNRITTNNGAGSSGSSNNRVTITNLQGNLSEQEALAIALGESMSDKQNKTTIPMTADEKKDAELAQAIYQSEIEAQERLVSNQGRQQQQTPQKCAIS